MSTHPSSWLAGEDLTTPAHDRHSVVEQPGTGRPVAEPVGGDLPYRRPPRAARSDALVFLAAVWVVVAAVPVAYLPTGRLDMLWNDTTVGVAAGVVTMIRLVRTGMAPATTGITVALGGWLAAAPFVLGYGSVPAEDPARWNDLASGTAIAVLSVATMVTTKAWPVAHEAPPPPGLVVGAVEPAD